MLVFQSLGNELNDATKRKISNLEEKIYPQNYALLKKVPKNGTLIRRCTVYDPIGIPNNPGIPEIGYRKMTRRGKEKKIARRF